LGVKADSDFGGFFRACQKVTLKKHQACADEKNKSGHGSANLKDLTTPDESRIGGGIVDQLIGIATMRTCG